MLSVEQQKSIDIINSGKNVLLTGPAGCGKSFLIDYIYDDFINKNGHHYKQTVGKTSLTRLSASIIGGVTLHSFLGLGLGKTDVYQIVQKVRKTSRLMTRYKTLRLLIIDEVSMLSSDLLEKVEEVLRTIRNRDEPFGGVQIILSGDFCQLPVIGEIAKFCFQSQKWNSLIHHTVYFKNIFRQTDDKFIEILSKIRLGIVDQQVIDVLSSRVNVDVSSQGIIPTKLYSTRSIVNDNNRLEIVKLINDNNKSQTFKATYSYIYSKDNRKSPSEIQQSFFKDLIDKSTTCDEELTLCVGAQVMILINQQTIDDVKPKYVNGSRGIITNFSPSGIPIVKLMNGLSVIIERNTWELEVDDYLITKTQIPLKLAWSVTIHKAQGLSLDCVETDIDTSIFEYGQVYVALSRVRTLEGLSILSLNPRKIKAHPDVLSYYKSIEKE